MVSLVLSTLLLTLAYADPACQGHECPLTVNTLLQAHTTNHDSARDAGEETNCPDCGEASFVEGDEATNDCPSGYTNILTASECSTAASALGLDDESSNDESHNLDTRPKGCFSWSAGAYFNPNSGTPSDPHQLTAPICQQAVTTYDLVGDGWCSWGGHQASLCATNYAVESYVRGQVAASNTATCADFDGNGYANSTFDEAKKLCDEEPNCQGFTYVTNRELSGWTGDIRLSSNITTFEETTNGNQCWKKAPTASPTAAPTALPTNSFAEDYIESRRRKWLANLR